MQRLGKPWKSVPLAFLTPLAGFLFYQPLVALRSEGWIPDRVLPPLRQGLRCLRVPRVASTLPESLAHSGCGLAGAGRPRLLRKHISFTS